MRYFSKPNCIILCCNKSDILRKKTQSVYPLMWYFMLVLIDQSHPSLKIFFDGVISWKLSKNDNIIG